LTVTAGRVVDREAVGSASPGRGPGIRALPLERSREPFQPVSSPWPQFHGHGPVIDRL